MAIRDSRSLVVTRLLAAVSLAGWSTLVIAQTGVNPALPGPDPCAGWSDQACPPCPLTFEFDPFPNRIINQIFVGWNNGTFWYDDLAVGPYLIPLEIKTTDNDRLLVKCESGCTIHPIPGDWTIDWEVSLYDPQYAYPFRGGSLVDASTIRQQRLVDRWAVMFLPPEDLAIGEVRLATITATIRDTCPCGTDSPSRVVFDAWSGRTAQNRWVYWIAERSRTIGQHQPKPCTGDPILCELVPGGINPLAPPAERFRSAPTMMFEDEIRPLTLAAHDTDRYQAECGIPNQFCSTFGHVDIGDCMTYAWAVDNLPNYTGGGVFDPFGTRQQTALFHATTPGQIRIRVDAISCSGDASTFYIEFLIVPRFIEFIDFDGVNQHVITRDGTAQQYGPIGPEWKDTDWDGQVTTVGEHNFPMAFTKGDRPHLFELKMGQTQGIPSMPGTVIYGQSTIGPWFAAPLDAGFHFISGNIEQRYRLFLDGGQLPATVDRHTLGMVWKIYVTFYRAPALTLATSHRLYTTLNAPLERTAAGNADDKLKSDVYDYWESAYDIACTNANTGEAVAYHTWLINRFNTLTLARKATDGLNNPDGTSLQYWGPARVVANPVCTHVKGMLTKVAVDDGLGTCGAFAQLQRLCLGLHGLPARVVEFYADLPVRSRVGGMVLPFGTVTWPRTGIAVNNCSFDGMKNITGTRLFYDAALVPAPGGAPVTDFDPDRVPQRFWAWDRIQFFQQPPPNPAANMHDANGKRGQGPVDNPVFDFPSHALVRYQGKYWDPSYGDLVGYVDKNVYAAMNIAAVHLPDMLLGPGLLAMMQPWVGPNGVAFHWPDLDH